MLVVRCADFGLFIISPLHVLLAVLVLGPVLTACQSDSSVSDPLFQKRSQDATGIEFTNTIKEDTSLYNPVDYFYVHNGAGVAVGDVNGNGLPDLYFSGNQVPGRLYLNRGDLQFEEGTEAAGIDHGGWATGVTFADVNGDGHLDLYICRAGPHPPEERANLLYVNDGDGTFSEQAAKYGVADTSATTQAAFFDYDRDGDLDLFLANHSNRIEHPNRIEPLVTDGTGKGNDRLYRNDGGTFADVTVEAGIVHPGMSLGLGVSDVNGDGWEDVYVSNDFVSHDYLYVNNGDGTFSERGTDWLKHHSYAAMGNALADVTGDGRVDILTLDMWPAGNEQQKRMSIPINHDKFNEMLEAGYHPQYWRNAFQVNNGLSTEGHRTFSDVSHYAGVEGTDWSWAPLVADFDNDGRRDLWVTNGYPGRFMIDQDFVRSYMDLQLTYGSEAVKDEIRQMTVDESYDPPRVDAVYRGAGSLRFEEAGAEWGVTDPSYSNGAAYADLDRDGDLDVVVSRIDQPAALYENILYEGGQQEASTGETGAGQDDSSASGPHFLRVRLHGLEANRRGLGAEVRLYCDGQMQHRHHSVTRGYQSSVEYPVHFGLQGCRVADSLRVQWPDGATELRTDVSPNRTLDLHRSEARPSTHSEPSPPDDPLLRPTDDRPEHRHVEEPFNDFSIQPLIPHKLSRSGPGVAVGDVNGNGREDLYIGGAFRHPGHLFVQRADGSFTGRPLGEEPYYSEDTAPLFFDADGDGALDLYVASGSSEFASGSEHLRDRLYLNDGTGSFTPAPNALPDLTTSTSTVIASDFDQDGDLDLFVGGRLAPRRWPQPGSSYLLRNDGGSFTDVTEELAPALREVGMVTSALWTDFNTDGRVDLIVVGEFMSIRFFENTGDRFREVTDQTGLANTSGWWNSIIGGDFDQDGDTDYVVGNLGLNTRYEASPSEPVSVYADDFDGNGHLDPILTHYISGTEYPVPRRNRFLSQLPGMQRQFPDYESYANASISDLFSDEQLEDALTLRATRFESSYLENLGDGRFRVHSLPGRAQLGPLYGLRADDVTGNGALDVLAVGNSYAPDVITGRHDALIGVFLRGNGEGQFDVVPHQESGFFVDGDAKGLARFYDPEGAPTYVATQNDDSTRVFTSTTGPAIRTVRPGPQAAYAMIERPDGSVERREFYYGSGYLSQSSRRLQVPDGIEAVTIYRYDGTKRSVEVPLSDE